LSILLDRKLVQVIQTISYFAPKTETLPLDQTAESKKANQGNS